MDAFEITLKEVVKPAKGSKLDSLPRYSLRHLQILSESENRKEYVCGCYHRRYKVVWSFFPVCAGHKKQLRKEWDARPWYKKLAGYALFGWLLVLFAAGLWMIIYLLYLIING
jgi:hypothetical protein